MEDLNVSSGWLSREELIFDRMASFHRRRVAEIAEGKARFWVREGGGLIVHLIPQECAEGRIRFDGATLEDKAVRVYSLGDRGSQSRFNADGWLRFSGKDRYRSFTQVYWDGRLEAAMSDLTYPMGDCSVFRAAYCEEAVFQFTESAWKFYVAASIKGPIWLFSALVGCEGVRFAVHPVEASDFDVDRSPVYLPELQIPDFDGKPHEVLRPWCDSFWQAGGEPRSRNYDREGDWHKGR